MSGAADCSICRAIPDYAMVERLHTAERLPDEVERLEPLYGLRWPAQLRRCPECGALYRYVYDHDSEAGVGYGYTDESIERLTPENAAAWLERIVHDVPFAPHERLERELEALLAGTGLREASVAELIARLEGDDPVAARRAAWRLGRLGAAAASAVPALARALRAGSPHAARALGRIGPAAVGPVLEALEAAEHDPALLEVAAVAAGLLGAPAAAAWPAVVRGLEREEYPGRPPHMTAPLRRRCAAALGRLGGGAAPAVPALVAQLGGGWVREAAIEALGALGSAALPALVTALAEPDWSLRWDAARALERIGAAAAPALPALRAVAAREREPRVVRSAASAAIAAIEAPASGGEA